MHALTYAGPALNPALRHRRAPVLRTILTALLLLLGVPMSNHAQETGFAEIDRLRASREQILQIFRSTGELPGDRAARLEQEALATIAQSSVAVRALALLERGTALRLTQRFDAAVEQFQQAAQIAGEQERADIAFDAWIGIARARAYGQPDHGEALAALQRAIAVAGDTPTRKQQYEIADYSAQLASARGELKGALIDALDALRLAGAPDQRFYAQLGVGDVLQRLAQGCDYRKLQDARSLEENNPWGACGRAVDAAAGYYEDARQTAQALGWDHLAREAAGFASRVRLRGQMIEAKARLDALIDPEVFDARAADDVLVSDQFEAGASTLKDQQLLAMLIDAVTDADDEDDPRTQFLLGAREDMRGDQAAALRRYERAAALLARERASFFDPRGRGTVVENRPELVRDLGLRLLSLGRHGAAFDTFESMRASGLSSLRAALRASTPDAANRVRFAALVGAESSVSARRRRAVDQAVAGTETDEIAPLLAEIRAGEAEVRALLADEATRALITRLDGHAFRAAALDDLTRAAKSADTAVALYWVTPANVVVWLISPTGSEVKTVFLPEPVLTAKVQALVSSVQAASRDFARTAAEALYTYLLAPFAAHLKEGRLLVVPQGVLVNLPFEVLVDPASGKHLIETVEVSYAPSATLAAEILRGLDGAPAALAAVYDPRIEALTQEIAGLGRLPGIDVDKLASAGATGQQIIDFLGSAPGVHVLLHGVFAEGGDPLQSYLRIKNLLLKGEADRLTAAELLAADWQATKLAVLSSCEGGRVRARVSNEIHGLSWAPLVGGAHNVLVSRWRVNAVSNGAWMQRFYQALAAGERTATAAARAMRAALKGQPHPYHWAAPQLFGW